ncbi:MAG: helix-turn-helix domain-containing protein [Gammaproteobacteria bacterium]
MPDEEDVVASFQECETVIRTLPALGRQIRARRKASSLRIDDAAALCGVSVDLLSRLENGKSGVSTQRLLAVLDGLGLVLLVVEKERIADLLPAEPPPP